MKVYVVIGSQYYTENLDDALCVATQSKELAEKIKENAKFYPALNSYNFRIEEYEVKQTNKSMHIKSESRSLIICKLKYKKDIALFLTPEEFNTFRFLYVNQLLSVNNFYKVDYLTF